MPNSKLLRALVPALALVLVALGQPARAAAPVDGPQLITFHGSNGALVHRHSHQLKRLKGTSPAFKHFVAKRLNRIWEQSGHRARCARTPVVNVERYRTDGWALGGESIDAYKPSTLGCGGGGFVAIYGVVDGRWHLLLGAQDTWPCADLIRFTVPSSIAGDVCFDQASGQEVPYSEA